MPKLYAQNTVEFPATKVNEKGEPDMENGKPDRRAGTLYRAGDEVPADIPGLDELREADSVSTDKPKGDDDASE